MRPVGSWSPQPSNERHTHMELNLEALGFTKEDLQQRVVENIAAQLLGDTYSDDEDHSYIKASQLQRKLEELITERIDEVVKTQAEAHILPRVNEMIENITIQSTNQWGEGKGTPVTFIEYLVKRAEEYMVEIVDSHGTGKGEGKYQWSGRQTRITHLIEKHLHYSIKTAMEDSLKIATSAIAQGIHETARIKLNEIAASLKVEVKTT